MRVEHDTTSSVRGCAWRRARRLMIVVVSVALAGACGLVKLSAETPDGGSVWNVVGLGSFRVYGAVMLNPDQYRSLVRDGSVAACERQGQEADLHAGARGAILDPESTV